MMNSMRLLQKSESWFLRGKRVVGTEAGRKHFHDQGWAEPNHGEEHRAYLCRKQEAFGGIPQDCLRFSEELEMRGCRLSMYIMKRYFAA